MLENCLSNGKLKSEFEKEMSRVFALSRYVTGVPSPFVILFSEFDAVLSC